MSLTPRVRRSAEISQLRTRTRSLTPEIVPEPKSLKGDRARAGALIAMRLSGVTAIAALIAGRGKPACYAPAAWE
jgi:hypothetical protein